MSDDAIQNKLEGTEIGKWVLWKPAGCIENSRECACVAVKSIMLCKMSLEKTVFRFWRCIAEMLTLITCLVLILYEMFEVKCKDNKTHFKFKKNK